MCSLVIQQVPCRDHSTHSQLDFDLGLRVYETAAADDEKVYVSGLFELYSVMHHY